jgi:hypothetical protein
MPLLVPGTTYDPLGRQTQRRMVDHRVICLHTMAGSFAGTSNFFHSNGYGGTESHLGMRSDGFTVQWQDLLYTADANYEGNPWVVSIETSDKGESFPAWSGSDVPPWTDRQLTRLIDLLRVLTSPGLHESCPSSYTCHQGIPRTLVPDSCATRRGIGYHRQGVDPWRSPACARWSQHRGKVCPGDRRIHQLRTIILPELTGTTPPPPPEEEDDMYMMAASNKPTRLLNGSYASALTPEGAKAWDNAGVKTVKVPVEDYDRYMDQVSRLIDEP